MLYKTVQEILDAATQDPLMKLKSITSNNSTKDRRAEVIIYLRQEHKAMLKAAYNRWAGVSGETLPPLGIRIPIDEILDHGFEEDEEGIDFSMVFQVKIPHELQGWLGATYWVDVAEMAESLATMTLMDVYSATKV